MIWDFIEPVFASNHITKLVLSRQNFHRLFKTWGNSSKERGHLETGIFHPEFCFQVSIEKKNNIHTAQSEPSTFGSLLFDQGFPKNA